VPVAKAKPKAEEPDLGALVAPPLRRSGDIPVRPPAPKRSNKLVPVLGALAALAIGFVIVVFVFPKSNDAAPPPPAPAPAPAPVVAVVPLDAAIEIDAPAVVASTTPEEIEMDPMQTQRGSAARPVGPRPTGTTPGPVTRPDVGSAAAPPPAVTPDAAVVEDKVENAPNNPTGGDECDEVSCVLSKYDRPCCERYKPKQADIAPRNANGVPEELDKSAVRAGVEKIKPRVVACGEKAGTKGTVKIAVAVAPGGNVTSATVAATPDAGLGDCVATAMKNATFAKTVNGGSFTYPFAF